jgi:hypothetical protein
MWVRYDLKTSYQKKLANKTTKVQNKYILYKNRNLKAYRETNAHSHYFVWPISLITSCVPLIVRKLPTRRLLTPAFKEWREVTGNTKTYVIAQQRSNQPQCKITLHNFRNTQPHPIERMVGYPNDDTILNSFSISLLRHAVQREKTPKISWHWSMIG